MITDEKNQEMEELKAQVMHLNSVIKEYEITVNEVITVC